jgi:recombinational DNA repair ATPase RecF
MKDNECLFGGISIIPPIKEITIVDEGIIKRADIKFKDGLNIITGASATGKTTVLNSIKKSQGELCISWESFEHSLAAGDKTVLLFNGLLELMSLKYKDKCILIDDLFERLDKDKKKIILKKLIKSKLQIIATSIDVKDINANIIDTKSFELR